MITERDEQAAAAVDGLEQITMFEPVIDPNRVALDDEAIEARPRRRLRVVSQPLLPGIEPRLTKWVEMAEREHPRTRGDCEVAVGNGPCPFVGCRAHLWADEPDSEVDDGRLPRRMQEFERLIEEVHPADWGETCSLRVAERVVTQASDTGKWTGHTSDGETIAVPAPELRGESGSRTWSPVPPEHAEPKVVDAAVIGRFLGLSREQVRKDYNRGAAAMRADPGFREWADAAGLDLDRYLDLDD